MDFIFGTLATDELKLVHHRVARRGVQHNYLTQPLDPIPDEPVKVLVKTGMDFDADRVAAYYTTDGSVPEGNRGKTINGQVLMLEKGELVWDTIAWAYVRWWHGTLPAQPENTLVRYRIGAWSSAHPDVPEVFGDYPELKATTERAAAAFFAGEEVPKDLPPMMSGSNVFSYHVDRYTAPDWARDAVIYQIIPDRFYPGDGREWLNPRNLMSFYGGTLWGVRDKMDYIAELGINCIWLTPTFPSPTHHGYDITDYMGVEARLGGKEAMHAMIEGAHERGIRVVLDLVANHISSEHPYFQDALNDPHSPYRDWFVFDAQYDIGYKTFFNVPTMPFLNLKSEAAKNWMLDVARFWIEEFDVDGYRLDHANGPGPDFWTEFRAACRAAKADSFCFGEVVEAPDILREYVGRLDGLLDFHMEDALRRTYAYGTMTEAEFKRFTQRHYEYFPDTMILPTFLDNHDMDRFLHAAGGDIEKLRRAAEAQMQLPMPPIIYYGTEVGLNQKKGKDDGWGLEVSREPMPWGDAQDVDLLTFYKRLIANRK